VPTCRSTQSEPLSNLPPWKYCLGFIPDHVVDKTLSATMQMVDTVEAETWDNMRDHVVSRLPELKVHHVNDTACVDTFFSSITSVQGFTCWTQYYFLKSGFDAVYLMRRRSQGPSTLPKMVTNCGAPNQIRSDNAPKFKGCTWMTYLWKHQIQSSFTEACHPNENPCECRGGALKAAVIHCLAVTNADLEIWCYCLEHICLLQSVIARH
jgi:hypothetical protein